MSSTPAGERQAEADSYDTRRETLDERMDRNWNEILQELRVVQTGTQLLTGFLISVAFQPRFASLDAFQRTTYLILITTAALTTAVGLAPVTLHRALFRRHAKEPLVAAANLLLKIALVGVGVMLVGVLVLIFDVAVNRLAGWLAGGATLLVLVVIAASPVALRRGLVRRGAMRPDPPNRDGSP